MVKVFTDSKNAVSISPKGSALEIFAYCAAHDISLEVEWIPCSLNSYADSVSRVDYDDWAVSTIFFQHVSSIFVLLTSIVSHPLFPLSASVFTLSSGVPVAKAWTLLVPVGAALTTIWFPQSFLSRVR